MDDKSSILKFPYVDYYNCEQGVVLMSLIENNVGSCLLPLINSNINDSTVDGRSNARETIYKSDILMASSLVPTLNPISSSVHQPTSLVNSSTTKLCLLGQKALGFVMMMMIF